MELKISREPVYSGEVIFDGQTEQGVEFDYILPDYYPDIFKILRCSMKPGIVSYSISGAQLSFDGVVHIKVLYLSENSPEINCIEQRYTYSKSLELIKPPERACVEIIPKSDYCNCRAVSGRRLDVRGAVSNKVKVTGVRLEEVITGVSGMGAQCRCSPMRYGGDRLVSAQQFVSREDIETGSGKDGISAIITHNAVVDGIEWKLVSDKVVAKAQAKLHALYCTKNAEGGQSLETMDATIPLSKITDVPGITSSHLCNVTMRIMDCSLEVRQSASGESRVFACDMTLDCRVEAYAEKEINPVSDVYSTDYECKAKQTAVKIEALPVTLEEEPVLRTILESADGTVAAVYDCAASVSNTALRKSEDNKTILSGQLTVTALTRLEDGTPSSIEKTEPFEVSLDNVALPEEYSADVIVQVTECGYNISGDSSLELRIGMDVTGYFCAIGAAEAIKEVEISEDMPRSKDTEYALKLYFAEAGEDVWAIARRYNTSPAAILTENELDGDSLSEAKMLIIPVI